MGVKPEAVVGVAVGAVVRRERPGRVTWSATLQPVPVGLPARFRVSLDPATGVIVALTALDGETPTPVPTS